MKQAQKWDFKTREYHPCMINDRASTFELDMDKIVACANCGEELPFGDGYTSHQIHNHLGFGYCVCWCCHDIECEQDTEVRR